MYRKTCDLLCLLLSLSLAFSVSGKNGKGETELLQSTVLNVPGDYATIQAAFNAAANNDTILVAPGTYVGSLTFRDKAVVLGSWFLTTGDTSYISQTLLDGGGGASVITIMENVGSTTSIIGFTIQNAEDGILPIGKFDVLHCRIRGCTDGIDYEKWSGGLCRNNVFENNRDDGIDLDKDVDIIIEDNIIRNNGDDGIEIRLNFYDGPHLNYIIRRNVIENNWEDGIQLIDYGTLTPRAFLIERNLIIHNRKAGIGLLSEMETTETFEGADIPERVFIFNNTFVGNQYGIVGGDSLVAVNNIFADHAAAAIRKVDAGSIVAHSIFWNNGIDFDSTNVDSSTILFSDPMLDSGYELQSGSPAIDAGTQDFIWQDDLVLELPLVYYSGTAPDLGAFEYAFFPAPPIADFSATPRAGEAPLLVQFIQQSSGDVVSFRWDFGNGDTSSEPNPIHVYRGAGSYAIKFTAFGPGGSDTETKLNYIIVDKPTPLPPVLVSPADGSSGIPLDPKLNWHRANAAIRYRVQVATDIDFTSPNLDQSSVTDTTLAVRGLAGETTYFWRVNSISDDDTSDWSAVWSFTTEKGDGEIPTECTLYQSYPNPFNPVTTITFDLPEDEFTTLKIYNARGEEVATLVSQRLNAGQHSYEWRADGLASGVYFYRLKSGDVVSTRKMMLVH